MMPFKRLHYYSLLLAPHALITLDPNGAFAMELLHMFQVSGCKQSIAALQRKIEPSRVQMHWISKLLNTSTLLIRWLMQNS